MKRKITELEQKLIENGWKLVCKSYSGKHSEKTEHYEYCKVETLKPQNINYGQLIKLNAKRTEIIDYGLLNVSFELLNEQLLVTLRVMLRNLHSFVDEITVEKWESDDNAASL